MAGFQPVSYRCSSGHLGCMDYSFSYVCSFEVACCKAKQERNVRRCPCTVFRPTSSLNVHEYIKSWFRGTLSGNSKQRQSVRLSIFYSRACLTMCPASGKISFSMQAFTALGEPGMQKNALPFATPAIARDSKAAEPISS